MNEEGENKCQLRFYVTSTESIWKSEYAQSVESTVENVSNNSTLIQK